MKLYLYYLIDNRVIKRLYNRGVLDTLTNYHTLDDGPMLYAITTSKKMARRFEECRNMNLLKKIVKEIDDEYEPDAWERIVKDKALLFANQKRLVIPLTGTEAWCVDNASEIIISYLTLHCNIHPSVFTEEVAEAMEGIGYMDIMGYHDDDIVRRSTRYRLESVIEWSNELGMLVWMFQEVMNLPGIMKVGDVDNESLEIVRRFKNS